LVGNALEQDIIGLYAKNIVSSLTINQIAKNLGKKYPYINKKVKFLIKENIFKRTVVGHSHLCSLNLSNDETIYLLILHELRNKKSELSKQRNLRQILEYVKKICQSTSIELAIRKGKKIFLVTDNEPTKTNLEKGIITKGPANYRFECITKEDFLTKIIDDRGLLEDHLILYGYERYYEYMQRIEDTLKIRYSKLIP
jgi:hypothetical protein